MTSLATLAHAAAAPPSPFNSALYATVATVIPVLYVALAFQGRSLQSLLSTYQALATQARKTVRHIRP